MAERRFLVRAGLRRNYGEHEVYYELSEEISATTTGEIREAFLNLQSLLENQITVYEKVSLPHVRLHERTGQTGGDEGSSDTFTLETIKVEFADNKKRIRACGGKYLKHGVPVYKECGTDLPIETLEMGTHDFRNLNMTVKVHLEGGKPKRAVSIK